MDNDALLITCHTVLFGAANCKLPKFILFITKLQYLHVLSISGDTKHVYLLGSKHTAI